MSQLQVCWYLKSMCNCIFCVVAVKNCNISVWNVHGARVIIVLYQLLLCVFVCTRERIVEVESASLSRPDWSFLLPLSAASCYSILQVRNIAATQVRNTQCFSIVQVRCTQHSVLNCTTFISPIMYCASLLLVASQLCKYAILCCYSFVQRVYLPTCTEFLLLWPSDQV